MKNVYDAKVGYTDSAINIYDMDSGILKGRVEGLQGYPISMSFSEDHRDYLLVCCGECIRSSSSSLLEVVLIVETTCLYVLQRGPSRLLACVLR